MLSAEAQTGETAEQRGEKRSHDMVRGAATPENYDAIAKLLNPQGKEIGQVILVEGTSGLLMRLEAHGLPQGWHAFHPHQTGQCQVLSFKSAGAHYHPDKHPHGFLHEGGPHAGDFPNIYVPADGRMVQEIHTERLSLSGDNNILDEDGSAFIIHEKADDYLSQPAGAAGERIACGVVLAQGEQ
jgi:Cu-Zn family superoxide dismutase